MGNLVWHDLARFISISASICAYPLLYDARNNLPLADAVWSGFHGLFFRKFFWDFVGGTLRDPGGLQYVCLATQRTALFICALQTCPWCCSVHHTYRQVSHHPDPSHDCWDLLGSAGISPAIS